MKPDSSTRGMGVVVALCAVAGLITVAVTLAFGKTTCDPRRG